MSSIGDKKDKRDSMAIRRLTIEFGDLRGNTLEIEIHPPSQTARVLTRWPSGQSQRVEHLSLTDLIAQLKALIPVKEN